MARTPARKTMVFLDTREQSVMTLALTAVLDEEPTRVALPEGDFFLVDPDGCGLLIERKTVADFLASLADGRLRSQLMRMQASAAHQGLIVEGDYRVDGEGYLTVGIGTRWTHAAYQMTLWSIQKHFPDLVVWWSNHQGTTADIIRALANRGKHKGCFVKTDLLAPVQTTEDPGGSEIERSGTRRRAAQRRHARAV